MASRPSPAKALVRLSTSFSRIRNGSADVLASLILIHSEERPAPYECYISFSFETKLLGLVLDGGTAWGSAPMGSTQALEKPQLRRRRGPLFRYRHPETKLRSICQ